MEKRSDKTPPFELQPPKKIPPKNDNPPFYHKLLSVQLCTQTHTEELACLDSLEYSLKYLHFFRECIHSRTRECKLQQMGDAFIDGIIGCSCLTNKIQQNKVQSTSGKSDILPAKNILRQIVFLQEFSNFNLTLSVSAKSSFPTNITKSHLSQQVQESNKNQRTQPKGTALSNRKHLIYLPLYPISI